jgi:hypothetical protein
VTAKAPRTRDQALFAIVPGVSLLLLSIYLFYGLFSGTFNVDEGAFVFLFLLMILAFFSSALLNFYGLGQFGLTDEGALALGALVFSVLYIVPVILAVVGLVIVVVGAIFGCVTATEC